MYAYIIGATVVIAGGIAYVMHKAKKVVKQANADLAAQPLKPGEQHAFDHKKESRSDYGARSAYFRKTGIALKPGEKPPAS